MNRHFRLSLGCATLIAVVLPRPSMGQSPATPIDTLEQTMAVAESRLRDGEMLIAESHYRAALQQGWMLAGALHAADGRMAEAKESFALAAASAVDKREAVHALALVHLQLGEAEQAVDLLTRLLGARTDDPQTMRLLAQALVANGHPEQAVQQLEAAHGASPDDPELAFVLASGYLRLKKIDAAEKLFATIAEARPLPQTHVLIGRAYRDAGEYALARMALAEALKKDPSVRRAHYYLGTIAVIEEGVVRLEEAIAEFQRELKLAPRDPVTNLRLGMALVEAQRPQQALGPLAIAVAAPSPPADAFHYLGRCQLALDRPAEAAASLGRALDLSRGPVVDDLRLLGIHYQLAQALRKLGRAGEAAEQFAVAEQLAAKRADSSRERLTRYMTDAQDAQAVSLPFAAIEPSPFSTLPAAEREAIRVRVTTALARAYLNLGVMHMLGQRFTRAAESFESAALVAPDFPQVQYSLGVAYFNAQQYAKAIAPLSRAMEADAKRVEIRRMLALTLLNAGSYEKAVELLTADPARATDPALQYAYGLALVRSNQAELAEAVFARLIAFHGATPELSVVLGQAHAQQGDFESAIQSLQRALALKPDVAEANATLGLIYLKQGKLAEAAAALRTELKHHPGDRRAAHTLATALDLEGQADEAIALLRAVLKRNPDYADARYLLGKVLLAQEAASEAVEHLEAAARIAPEDANIHYQLAQAYRKLGRVEDADARLEIYRQLKDKRRTP